MLSQTHCHSASDCTLDQSAVNPNEIGTSDHASDRLLDHRIPIIKAVTSERDESSRLRLSTPCLGCSEKPLLRWASRRYIANSVETGQLRCTRPEWDYVFTRVNTTSIGIARVAIAMSPSPMRLWKPLVSELPRAQPAAGGMTPQIDSRRHSMSGFTYCV